eukprot:TRINITY_DN314_c0_g2_i1.p1 TRINITY_DN314_c0_g2~~TRINITY_DN314_c0_g2_i1.p1  ORF type:complete len:235 (+),score=113.70 TRINITY_DN314_c0_g2_i1:141-845(+)
MPNDRTIYWVPLESNPEVLNKFCHGVGMSETFSFNDCWSLEEDALTFVPQPVQALVFLFPYDAAYHARIPQLEQETADRPISPNVWYMKQLVANACGTVALIHSLANNVNNLNITEGKLKDFLDRTRGMSPLERGQALEQAEAVEEVHSEVAQQGQTRAPSATANVECHFICFTKVENHLYELDGGKSRPLNHGPTTDENFLKDAINVIKRNYIANNPDNPNFSVLTLGPATTE